MGQVIELCRAQVEPAPAANALFRCARCGAELWNLFADGRVRCADCEQECPLRAVPGSETRGPATRGPAGCAAAHGQEYELNKGE